jgi:soluble lytic murein transglycosylase-like protein
MGIHARGAARSRVRVVLAMAIGLWIAAAVAATAATGHSAQICDRAAQGAATRTGVPVQVLRAITRTETGRTREGTFGPWPWTVNHAGHGLWFDDPAEALGYLAEARRSGARNFDVGCFQINYHWHGHAFGSLEDMLDPDRNASYAAEFLTALREELGDWDSAVGAFHSRTPEFSALYLQRYRRILAALSDPVPARPAEPDRASRAASRPPQALDLSPRSSLFTSARPGRSSAAPLFRTVPARPLWEEVP